MAKQVRFKYKCEICGRAYEDMDRDKAKTLAEECEASHGELVYVPLTRGEVTLLYNFILTRETRFLTERIVHVLKQYREFKL